MSNAVTITKAAKLAGITRQTMSRKISDGELSKNSEGKIDISELLRLYPDIKLDDTEGDSKASNFNATLHLDIKLLEQEIKYLKKEVAKLEKIVVEKDAQIDMLARQTDKLISMNEKLQAHALPDYSNRKTGSWWTKLWGK